MKASKRASEAGPERFEATQLDDDSAKLWEYGFSEVAQKMLTSAVRCFAAKGFHATTTRDITSGAKLSPAALYVHFDSKEDVLYTISRVGHKSALAVTQGPEDDDPAQHLRSTFARYVAWHARYHVTGRVNQYEMAALSSEHYAEILTVRHETNDVFRKIVLRGAAEGSFVPVDVNRVVRAMNSLAIDLVRWYRLEGSDSPEQLGAFYAEVALGMVTNPALAAASASPSRRRGGK
ncbi:TetR/AcrR family transcriptional regulator [Streptomyces sp. NPDC086777]|uniref:TetR/AcrR family transcriptional regulator n=1 Tax=Streptomyces sp. NPDC086777 TaxID=3154866 RepID=UPI00344F7836